MFLIRITIIANLMQTSPEAKPPEYRPLRVELRLTRSEQAALKAICTEERIDRATLIEAFIADLTKSERCVAPDFEWWLECRAFSHPDLACYGRFESPRTTTRTEIDRRLRWLYLWQMRAWGMDL
ncbi:MAG: hypothetical protein ACFUZC_05955 [Chthoniobacteraceae bacterium]